MDELCIEVHFVISRSSNGKFGVGILGIDSVTGQRLGPVVPVVDAIFSTPAECGDVVAGAIRGAVQNRVYSPSRDELGLGRARSEASATKGPRP